MSHFATYEPERHGTPDPDVLLRAATSADVDGIVAVARTRGPLAPGYPARVAAWVGDAQRLVLVGVLDERVVGWAMAARWEGYDDVPDGFYVSALTVAPAARRRGLGERLLLALVAWARPRSAMLGSVINATNRASLDLHERHGFREVARGPAFAGITFSGGTGVLLMRSES